MGNVGAHDIALWQFFERRSGSKGGSEPPDRIKHHEQGKQKMGIYYQRRPKPLSRRERSSEVKNMAGRVGSPRVVCEIYKVRRHSILHQKVLESYSDDATQVISPFRDHSNSTIVSFSCHGTS